MKKLTSAIIFTLLLISEILPFVSFASISANVSSSKNEINTGESVTFTVSVSSCTSASFGVDITYDPDMFEIASGSWKLSGEFFKDFSDGCAILAYTEPQAVSGTIFTFTLTSTGNAGLSSVSCDISVEGCGSTTRQSSITVKCKTHTYGDWEKVNDTQHKHTCECGAEETENHTWNNGEITTPATHTTTGVKTLTCTKCSATKTETIEKTTAHNYGAWTKVDENTHKHTCECGKEETENHTWNSGTVTTSATHTKTGVKTYTCTKCGATKTETIPVTTEHHFGAWTKVDENTHKHTCECGEVETENHTWDTGKVTTSATHTKTGVKTYTCTKCGATKTETIPVTTEHHFGAWTKVDENTHKHTCECGAEETENHTWDKGTVTTPATHTTTGVKTLTCTKCGATKTETIEKTTEHNYGAWTKISDTQHKHTCECGAEETENHTWDKGTVTKKATCKDEGVKTYSCTKCGAAKTETIPVSTEHNYGKWVKVDENTHKHTCPDCGKEETGTHTWGTGVTTKVSTHTSEGEITYTCTLCGATKKTTTPKQTEHNYGAWTKVSDTQHKHTCECGEEETEAHTWNAGAVTKEPTCKDEGAKTYTCTKCGATKVEKIAKLTTHTYTNDCDPDCNVCGATREVTHQYRTEWSYDGTSHWHTCTVCGIREGEATHTPGSAATEISPQVCTVCGYIIAPALGHTHNYSSAYTTDENGHWYACSGCSEKKDYAAHVYDNGCDKTCNICGYERTTEHTYDGKWTSDETGHWHECTECGEKKDFAEHVPGKEATEDTPQTCVVCDYVIHEAIGHTHDFGTDWICDENAHWHECKCGEKSDYAAHEWDGGTVVTEPTASAEGLKQYTCIYCGAAKAEPIEKLSSDPTDPGKTAEPADPTNPTKPEESSNLTKLIAIIAGSVILLAVVLLLVFKRKKNILN